MTNLSMSNTEPTYLQSTEEEGESAASRYIEYIEQFGQYYNTSFKPPDRSESNLQQNSVIQDVSNNNITFNDDEPIDKSLPMEDKDLSIHEAKGDISRILNYVSFQNMQVIQEEKDESFTSNKRILSMLDEGNKPKTPDDEESIASSVESDVSYDHKFFKPKEPWVEEPNFDIRQPHFKLEAMNQQHPVEYYCFQGGVYKSGKNTLDNGVMIGRLHKRNGVIPNDIIVEADMSVSRIHCRVVTKYGFQTNYVFSKKLLAFLLCISKRKVHKVSINALRLIVQYLTPEKGFYLQDLGSCVGTYIKLRSKEDRVLSIGSSLLIGFEAKLTVVWIKNTANTYVKMPKGLNLDTKNAQFIGFDESMLNPLNLLTERFIILGTENCSSAMKPYLVLKARANKPYLIGRKQNIDVSINLIDISRTHCEIRWCGNNWIVKDGSKFHPSFNGTWINIAEHNVYNKRSAKVKLEPDDRFKVSNAIFHFKFSS